MQIVLLFFRRIRNPVQQSVDIPLHGGERCGKVMGNACNELLAVQVILGPQLFRFDQLLAHRFEV